MGRRCGVGLSGHEVNESLDDVLVPVAFDPKVRNGKKLSERLALFSAVGGGPPLGSVKVNRYLVFPFEPMT